MKRSTIQQDISLLHVFKLIIVKCIVGAGDGLCCCRATEGSVEQHCTAVVTPCQVKFAASCAELSAVLSTSEHKNSSALSVHWSKGAALIQAWTNDNIKGHCSNGLVFVFLLYVISCQALLNKLLCVLLATAVRDV